MQMHIICIIISPSTKSEDENVGCSEDDEDMMEEDVAEDAEDVTGSGDVKPSQDQHVPFLCYNSYLLYYDMHIGTIDDPFPSSWIDLQLK